jgi:hypothetical protein
MQPSARLLHAWRQTTYRVNDIEVLITRRSLAMDALLSTHGVRAAVFVTAWNPLSRPMPIRWNRRMHEHLKHRLRRRPTLPADGSWRQWREEHLLALVDPRVALRLARLFRQAAVVIVRRGQPAALMTSFPVFSPRNSIPNARGPFSSPSTMCSFCCRCPLRICAESHVRASW